MEEQASSFILTHHSPAAVSLPGVHRGLSSLQGKAPWTEVPGVCSQKGNEKPRDGAEAPGSSSTASTLHQSTGKGWLPSPGRPASHFQCDCPVQ